MDLKQVISLRGECARAARALAEAQDLLEIHSAAVDLMGFASALAEALGEDVRAHFRSHFL